MKTCPICHSNVFDDMDVCYGCMYRFARKPPEDGTFHKIGGGEVIEEPQFDEPQFDRPLSHDSSNDATQLMEPIVVEASSVRDEGAPIQTSVSEVRLPMGQSYKLVITLEPVTSSCGSSAQADRSDRGRTPSCRE